ncbi:hypothetical protein AB3Y40_18975 [Yoonia sp. R2331]|uniref:hypothetical protein n=1 Tax=Yoonia sp. R2331 TaxID=3237238 RepID=UPI0034E4030C
MTTYPNTTVSHRLNLWHLTAAALMALTTLIHVFVGGPEVMDPIRASTLDPLVIGVASVVWHAITLLLALFAVALLWLARNSNKPLVALLLAMQLGFGLIFLGYGIADLGTIWPMPQWIIFFAIPALMLVGQRGRK